MNQEHESKRKSSASLEERDLPVRKENSFILALNPVQDKYDEHAKIATIG